jgi:hypothetical protein
MTHLTHRQGDACRKAGKEGERKSNSSHRSICHADCMWCVSDFSHSRPAAQEERGFLRWKDKELFFWVRRRNVGTWAVGKFWQPWAAAESDFPRNAGASGLACDWDGGSALPLTPIQLHPPAGTTNRSYQGKQYTMHYRQQRKNGRQPVPSPGSGSVIRYVPVGTRRVCIMLMFSLSRK